MSIGFENETENPRSRILRSGGAEDRIENRWERLGSENRLEEVLGWMEEIGIDEDLDQLGEGSEVGVEQ